MDANVFLGTYFVVVNIFVVFIHLKCQITYSNKIVLMESVVDLKNKNRRREVSYAEHHVFINISKFMQT